MPEANLYISRAVVRSFRGLSLVDISFERSTTFLVGENNSGKSSILLALATALGKRRATRDDLLRERNGSTSTRATIDLFLSPTTADQRFTDETRQRLLGVQREPDSTREVVVFRTTLQPSSEGSLLLEHRAYLQPQPSGQWAESPTPPFQPRLLDLLEAQLIEASRDLLHEMNAQTSSWGRLLSDLRIPESSEGESEIDGRDSLESDLQDIGVRVRSASPVLRQLHDDLERITATQRTVGRVQLIPLPMRIEDLARSIEVLFSQDASTGLPLRFQGLGSRSLAALLVFRTMCALKVGQDSGVRPHLVTLIEEPEAHLHPHAVVALLQTTLAALPGQRVVTTHSPTLVAEAPPSSVRLLRRTNDAVKVVSLGALTARQSEKFRRFFGRPFGECFFSRLVIFGDGVTERDTLPVLVSMALHADPASLGITFVDCRSMSRCDEINPVLRALHNLQIPWLVYADNDPAGLRDLSNLLDPGTGAPLDTSHPCVVTAHDTQQTERLLIDAGFTEEVIAVAGDNGRVITTDDECFDYLCSQKAWAPHEVALRAREAQKSCPHQLDNLIQSIKASLAFEPSQPEPTG